LVEGAPRGDERNRTMAMVDEVKAGKDLYAHFDTTEGKVVVKLFSKDAPKTGTPLYDGTIFHRCIADFMVQGGDPLGRGTGGPGYQFGDEFGSGRKFDKPGLLAMANAGPNTNGSQFFITEVPTPHLNNRHTIFGEVVKGFELVPRIARVEATGSRPNTPVIVK